MAQDRVIAVVCLLVLSTTAAAQVTGKAASSEAANFVQAEIRTTSYGVPHVLAKNYAGVGFGLGYAYAKADICEFAGRWVTVRSRPTRDKQTTSDVRELQARERSAR